MLFPMISVLRAVCSFARSCYPGTDKEQRVLEKQHTKGENNILDPLKLNVPLTLRYADNITLMVESEEELKIFLMKEKVESEKAGLKLNIQK